MPTSTRRYKSFLRKSSANSFVPLGRCGHRPLRNTWRIHAATWAFSLLTPSLSSHKQQNKKRGRLRTTSLSFSYRANLLSFNRNDFTAIVIAASLAHSVRQLHLCEAGGARHTWGKQQRPGSPVSSGSCVSYLFSRGILFSWVLPFGTPPWLKCRKAHCLLFVQ